MLPESEFRDWQRYAARRMLPARRVELYLAQIALLIDTRLGSAKDVTLSDYLFDPVEPDDDDEPTADEEAAFFAFNPRKPKET